MLLWQLTEPRKGAGDRSLPAEAWAKEGGRDPSKTPDADCNEGAASLLSF